MGRLDRKRAVVVGAAGAGNMGQVIARRLAAEGASVLVAGRRVETLQALAGEIGGHFHVCDITNREAVFSLESQAAEKLGGCDILVNAAGLAIMTPSLDVSEEEIDQLTDLHVKGPFFLLQAFGKYMSTQSGGAIIQISSATTQCPVDNSALYIGTKAAGDHFVKAFAHELGPSGVRINSIAPGLTETPMTAQATATPGLSDAFVKRYPLGRIGTSEDIADAVVWLSEDSCFMTGQVLQVNGGLTLRGNPTGDDVMASIMSATSASEA